jgi:hypothetical protein
MNSAVFDVSIGAISRRLKTNGGDGVFLLVKVPGVAGSPDDLVQVVRQATRCANAALDRGDDVDVVWAGAVMPTLKGPMINLDWVGTEEQNHEWLDVFAEQMQSAGYSGTITAAPQANLPASVNGDYFNRTRLTAYLAYSLTTPVPPHSPPAWRVDSTTTEVITSHALRWGYFAGADVYVSEGVAQIHLEFPEVADALTTGVRRSSSARLICLVKKPAIRSRIVTFAPDGQVCYQAGGDGRAWADDIDLVRNALLHMPEALDAGFVRRRSGFGGSWMDLHGDPFRLKYVDHHLVENNRHLWSRYLPDPNGVQVVTQAHLERAADLSSWEVRQLAGGRYLVQARDLRPWYEPEVPDPELIDAARVDFGDMILTREVIETDPTGWIPGRPWRTATE